MTRKTWTIPPEPDDSVTHVRDAMTNRVWRRHANGRWVGSRKTYGIWWHQLIAYGPLTDATGDEDAAD